MTITQLTAMTLNNFWRDALAYEQGLNRTPDVTTHEVSYSHKQTNIPHADNPDYSSYNHEQSEHYDNESEHSNYHYNYTYDEHTRTAVSMHVNYVHTQQSDYEGPFTEHIQNGGHSQSYHEAWHNQHHYDIDCNSLMYESSYDVMHTNTPVYEVYHANADGDSLYIPAIVHSNVPSYQNTTYSHSDIGFDHINYVPSTPYIYYDDIINASKPLCDVVTFNLFSYDANLHDNKPTNDTPSKEIYFSVDLRKISNSDGTAAVDQSWKKIPGFTKSVGIDGQNITQTGNPVQKADDNGLLSFTLDTKNPFSKAGSIDYRNEEGVYEIRVTAWNTYQSERGVTKYYISSSRIETFTIRQNFVPEIKITNKDNIVNFVFGKQGVKTTAPSFKTWNDYITDTYGRNAATSGQLDADANGYPVTGASLFPGIANGILVQFRMKDDDTETDTVANWHKGKAYLKNSSGTVIAQTDVWFSENPYDPGTKTTLSEAQWKTGYAYFGSWLFPDNADLTNSTVTVEIKDYLDSACTNEIGSSASDFVTFHIDTKVPVIADITSITPGLNTSIVAPGADVYNAIYSMKFKINITDSHALTKIRDIMYIVNTSPVSPDITSKTLWSPVLVTGSDIDYMELYGNTPAVTLTADGGFIIPPDGITNNGTYYVHVYTQDFAGNTCTATYGAYKRIFEPEIKGIYLANIVSAGKNTSYNNLNEGLGLSLGDDMNIPYNKGYQFTIRTSGINLNKSEMWIEGFNNAGIKVVIPVKVLKISTYTAVSGILPPSVLYEKGVVQPKISMPSISVPQDISTLQITEYTVYVDIDEDVQSVKETGTPLDLNIRYTSSIKYPDGHPLAGQFITTTQTVSNVLNVRASAKNDGGINRTN